MSKDRTFRQKRKKASIQKIGAAVLATVLVVAIAVGLIPNNTAEVLAVDKVSDLSTITKYTESLGATNSTEYAGRIWTDKTVWAEDSVKFEAYGGAEYTVEKNTGDVTDEDFLVGFSALATSQSISGQTQAPLDVVFVIDLSGSMSDGDSNMDNGYSRIYNTVQALNQSIESLMALNQYTRVSVVGFSTDAEVLLPLDHYSKYNNQDYFDVSRTTGSDRYSTTLTVRATGVTNGNISDSTSVSGGTNIQRGFYVGMNQLASTSSTTVTINGKTVTRVPSVVLLGDGSPTYSSSSTSWWAPGTGRQGSGSSSSARYGNGFKAMMTASWMKAAIDAKYGVKDTASATKVYTIGMGIDDIQYTDAQRIARITLNPEAHWHDNNTIAESMRDAWETYITNNETPRVTVQGNSTYTVTHPTGNNLPVPDATFINDYAINEYVDTHYDANAANDVDTVFQNIVNAISISAPQVPTEHDAANPMTSGFITYTDPIGEYMEVKDFKSIIYGGIEYTVHSSSTTDNVTTYVFTEKAEGNAVYGAEELSHIIIKVTSTVVGQTAEGEDITSQVLTIEIPASLIPLRVNSVTLDADGSVISHTNNGAYPIRVLYTVGLQDAVKKDGNVLLEEISEEYRTKHLNEDGTIDFYSNLYTGTNIVNGNTAGDATAVFDAASTNPFYYMQENQYLYTDEDCTQYANTEALDATTYYYYKETHYEGTVVVTNTTVRTGAQLTGNTVVVREDAGDGTYRWYRPAGTPRVNRMLEFEGTKQDANGNSTNHTGTAADFYAPTYNGTTGHFTVYLGNNGKMSFEATGSLEISKTVTASNGLTAPDANFTFKVDLEDGQGNALTGQYSYAVTDAEGNGVHEGTVSNGGTITLKAGQTAKIIHLPPNAEYTVTEINIPSGFAITDADKTVQTGTIVAGSVSSTAFENNYSVTPVVYPAQGELSGTKVLVGREWSEKDTFTFFIEPYNDAPLPEGYDSAVGVTVTTATDNTAIFVFGSDEDGDGDSGIEFTAPGVYRYTVFEKEPENNAYLPGMSYSRALYRIVVTVVDDGDGTLTATPNIQKLYTDDATPLFTYDDDNNIVMNSGQEAQDDIVFTNTYSAKSVTRVPVALKEYTDNSGENPLVSGMFKFELTPLGYLDVDGELVENTAGENPMPEGAGSSVVTENEGHNITFPSVTFTEDDIPEGQDSITYRYQMTEVRPSTANESTDYTVDGMKYDSQVVVIDVTVARSAESDTLIVNAVYPDGLRIATFKNEYTPSPVSIEINGEKTLTGRDMKAQEEFNFSIVGANAATNLATGNGGSVTVPATSEVAVSGGKNGEAEDFTFGEFTFTKPGTFTFNITEEEGTAGGVTYDKHTCTVTVVVTDNNGQLEAAVTYSDGEKAIFNNTYVATFDDSTAISLFGTKQLTGRPIIEGEFYFDVAPQNNAPVALADDIYVPAAGDSEAENGVYEGAITFLNNVKYDTAGTYVYKISEVIPTDTDGNEVDHGVDYDKSEYTVTVEVEDDLNGNLKASITSIVKKAEGGAETVVYDANTTDEPFTGELAFANKYEADPTDYTFSSLYKLLTGDRKDALKAGEFEFVRTLVSATDSEGNDISDGIVLYKVDDPSTTENESLQTVDGNGSDIVGNNADGTIQFGNMRFTKAGTYVIEIREVIPADNEKVAGVTYDTQVLRATYTVTDDLRGNLLAVRTKVEGLTTFTNTYETEGALEGSENLKVTKRLDLTRREDSTWGTDANDTFTFVLEAGDENTKAAIEDGTVIMPQTTITINGNGAAETDTSEVYTNAKVFESITFKAVGKYTFIIRELDGAAPGMDYDATARTITVETTDNGDGTLNVVVEEGSQTNPTFTNVYTPGDVILAGHDNLHVNKVFTGRPNNEWLSTDSFTFTLEANTSHAATQAALDAEHIVMPTGADGTQITVNKDNKDHAHFGNITFKAAGTYQFIIKEVVPADGDKIPGVTYDSDVDRIVQVVVTQHDKDEEGNDLNESYLTVAIDYANSEEDSENGNAFTFTNTYSTTPVSYGGEGELDITKTIVGRQWKDGDTFNFVLNPYNDAAETVLESMSLTMSYQESDSGEYDKIASFGEIQFKVPGTYEFIISEEGTDTNTMTYDKHTEIVTIVVKDNEDGTLVVESATKSGDMTWQNTYVPVAKEVTLTGTKVIEGRDMTADDKFFFSIVSANDASKNAMPVVQEVQNKAAENNKAVIEFGPISFSEAGTYEYYIYEQTVNSAGITSDTGYVKATVEVTYSEATGELTVGAPTYQKINSDGEGFQFINTYSTTGKLDGSLHLNVVKNFIGRANNEWLSGDEFKFTLAIDSTDDATSAAWAAGDIAFSEATNGTEITIGYNDVHKQKAFGDITFRKEGTYKFIVTETVPAEADRNGITYDGNPARTIIVNTNDNDDGTLTVTVDDSSEFLTFENKYKAQPTTLDGEANLVVEKKINGRDWITKDTYTFALSADVTHTSTNQALTAENIVMPEKVQVTITDETPDYKDAFGDITFKEAGTYRFVVSEVTPADADKIPGIAYATRSRVVYVNVVDNNDGTMTATADSAISESLVFVNTYTTAAESTYLVGTKKITGRDLLSTDKFQFTISEGSGSVADTPLPETVTVENDANGTITFGPINFTKVGTYKYVITEEATSISGITDTTQGIDVTVKVVDDYDNAKLTIESVTYEAVDEDNEDIFAYTNTYTTGKSNPVSISAEKIVTPKVEGNSYTMKEGDFGFKITPDSLKNKTSDPIDETIVYNDAEGNVVFVTDKEYTEPGDYIYYIEEVTGKNGTLGGFDCDDAKYTVTVVVKDDYEKAKLEAEKPIITKTKDGKTETVEEIIFNNIYNPEETSEEIKGTKELTVIGSDKVLEDGEFKFKLEAIDNAPMPEGAANGVKEVTNTSKTFSFGSITYTVPNTYKYLVTEVADDTKRDYIDYDETVYEVTIKVEDVNGELTVTQNSTTTTPIEFENTYEPVEVTLQGDTALAGKKVLDGRDLDKDEFTFQLIKSENGDDEVVMEVKNDVDGNFKFEPITFKEEGTFYYIIKEVKGSLGGVTYDENPDSVKIVVSDVNGHLEADVTYENSENNRADFKNTYKAEGTEVIISATKKLSGRDLRVNEFTFILMDEDGNEIETVKNAADGTISFTALEYEDGEEGTYVYKVAEVKGDAGHIKYDENVYEVTVTITDNKEGKLVSTMTVKDDEKLIFNNAYTPADAKVTLSGKKILMGRDLVAEEFTFLLKDAEGKVVGRAKNNANGTFAFDEIVFTQVGTFQYVVEEDSSAAVSGITYDKSRFDVVIKVTDNGEGQLIAEVSGMDKVIFTNSYKEDVVKTGDTIAIMPIMTMFILSAGYILVSLTKARKR